MVKVREGSSKCLCEFYVPCLGLNQLCTFDEGHSLLGKKDGGKTRETSDIGRSAVIIVSLRYEDSLVCHGL